MPLAFDPLALPLGSVLGTRPNSYPVLLAFLPAADVFVSVRPLESTLSVLFAVLEVALVLPAVGPNFHAPAFHVAHPELALIHLVQICEVVLAKALELPIHEVAIIVAPIFPLKPAFTVLLAFEELASVLRSSIVPSLGALTVLHVLHPVAFVPRSKGINENPKAIGLVASPVTLVNVAIRMSHPAFTIRLVFRPHSLVL